MPKQPAQFPRKLSAHHKQAHATKIPALLESPNNRLGRRGLTQPSVECGTDGMAILNKEWARETALPGKPAKSTICESLNGIFKGGEPPPSWLRAGLAPRTQNDLITA